MKTIHIVMGTTGEYSDRQEWAVAAYTDAEKAAAHAKAAYEFLFTAGYQRFAPPPKSYLVSSLAYGDQMRSPWDPELQMQSYGTEYYVIEVPFRTELPEVGP